jgi:C1A family cysteine protease/PKD repeat protein
MKALLFLFTGFLVSLSVIAQEGEFAPLNPDFVRYLEQTKSQELKKGSTVNPFRLAPSPLKLNFANYKSSGSLETKNGTISPLPKRYDLRDSGYVTPVKNQGKYYTCWAFAAMAAIESNWLVNHWGSYDLSEQNISACNGVQYAYDGGGDHLVVSSYFSRLAGPVLETDDPYKPPNACKGIKYPVPRYVLTSRILPYDPELIKRTIMKYGAINFGMMAGFIWNKTFTGFDFDKANYNPLDYTFYYSGSAGIDHVVCLVGWDDDKIITGGDKSPKGTEGAWIVKNSLGTDWGENGYFYLSYFDNKSPMPLLHFDQFAEPTEIDRVNMYDEIGATKAFGYNNEIGYGITRFNAPEKEIIVKIGTYILSAASSIDIEIYKDFTDGKLSGLLYEKNNIYCEFPGQRVFDVLAVVEGVYFIRIKYNTPTFFQPIPVETNIYYSDVLPPVITSPGTNWVSKDGQTWETLGKGVKNREMDLTIRSYTKSIEKCLGSFELPAKQICFGEPLRVAAELADSTTECNWQFLPDGIPANDSGPGPVVTQFASPGVKKVNLILKSQNRTDTITRSLEVTSALDVKIRYAFDLRMEYYAPKEREIPGAEIGKSIYLSVQADADSFKWSAPYDTINQSAITVSPGHIGRNLFSVTAYQGNCFGTDTISVEGSGGLFKATADTLFLTGDSASFAQVIIDADTTWNVIIPSATVQKWLGLSKKSYLRHDTVSVISLSSNYSGKIREGYITLSGPLMKLKSILVIQDFVTGTDEPMKADKILLFPNPALNELVIQGLDARQFSACTLRITDITGRVVKKPKAKTIGRIDVSELSKGLYFIEVREDKHKATVLRFLKE